MRQEVAKLEILRQRIEQAEFEAGDASDFIDRGRPSPEQLKQAQNLISQKEEEVKVLMSDLHILLANCPQDILDEWVTWHKVFLRPILDELHDKVRVHIAKQTWGEWENVALRKQEFVRINWHFLKDYKESVKTQIHI